MANLLKRNLHSHGWISNVGVLYKGIWLPAELHDIQSALWQVYSHRYRGTERKQRVIYMLIYGHERKPSAGPTGLSPDLAS